MKLFTIWDIDNCIADDHWRQERIEWDKTGDERYRAYNEALEFDCVCNTDVFKLFIMMGCEPVFFTGRSEYLRNKTNHWLEGKLTKLGMKPRPIMYMRPNNHEGSPRDVKETMLTLLYREHMGFGNRIVAAFDDLPPVVKMYRDHNIPATVLAINLDLTKAYKAEDLKV